MTNYDAEVRSTDFLYTPTGCRVPSLFAVVILGVKSLSDASDCIGFGASRPSRLNTGKMLWDLFAGSGAIWETLGTLGRSFGSFDVWIVAGVVLADLRLFLLELLNGNIVLVDVYNKLLVISDIFYNIKEQVCVFDTSWFSWWSSQSYICL